MKTKGATSYVLVSLSELNQKLSPNSSVLISKRWAKAQGVLASGEHTAAKPTEPAKEENKSSFFQFVD